MNISGKVLYLSYIIGSIILSMIPVINWPFNWLETYFHEISHGLTALLTGGHVDRIELYLTGGGKCFTSGGWAGLIAFSGYAGAILWGGTIYLGAQASGLSSRWLAIIMSAMIVASIVFWARDFSTVIILSALAALMYFSFRTVYGTIFPRVMEFVGIYILVGAVRSPLNLIDGRHRGDGSALSELTYIPEIVWVIIWFTLGIAGLIVVWLQHDRKVSTPDTLIKSS